MNKKQTTAVKKSKRAPSKMGRVPYDVDELRCKIFYDAPKALNEEQLYTFLGISHDTFYKLKKNNADFSEAIKHYKRISPLEVLSSFKKRAMGFTFDEEVKELQKDKNTGKMKLVVTKVTTKYFAPDAGAGYNYLKNQLPEEFKEKIEATHNIKGSLQNITFILESTDAKTE